MNVDRYGNTSSASIPLALAEAIADGRVQQGDTVLMTGMGAGLDLGLRCDEVDGGRHDARSRSASRARARSSGAWAGTSPRRCPRRWRCSSAASEACGLDLRRLCFDTPLEEMVETEVQQPALVATSLAMLAALRVHGVHARLRDRPLGRRVRRARRGQLGRRRRRRSRSSASAGLAMAEAAKERPGSMAAILGLDDEVVERLCRKILGVWPANYNCPGQIVVSGENDAVDELLREGRGGGRAPHGQAEGLGRVPLAARRARGRAAAARRSRRSGSASRRRRSCPPSPRGSRRRSGWARCSSTS